MAEEERGGWTGSGPTPGTIRTLAAVLQAVAVQVGLKAY